MPGGRPAKPFPAVKLRELADAGYGLNEAIAMAGTYRKMAARELDSATYAKLKSNADKKRAEHYDTVCRTRFYEAIAEYDLESLASEGLNISQIVELTGQCHTSLRRYLAPDLFAKFKANAVKRVSVEEQKILPRILDGRRFKYQQTVAGFKPDAVSWTLKLVVLYEGDYWHCNPQIFSANFFHKHQQMLAKDVWKRDQARIAVYLAEGLSVLRLWSGAVRNTKTWQERSLRVISKCPTTRPRVFEVNF